MLTLDIVIVFIVILFILISLYTNFIGIAFTFIISVLVLGLAKILTPEEILHGFSNQHIHVILMLLLLSGIFQKTGTIEVLLDKIFHRVKTKKGFIGRMSIVVASFSAFLNNTPLVAVMMPYIYSWCKRTNNLPSKFLIPLSYATILGGCATLIGTFTNLIVNGMVNDQHIFPNLRSLEIFDFVWVGVPMIIIGTLYLMAFSNRLLPKRSSIGDDVSSGHREYIIHAQVRNDSHLIGKTISEANLRNLKGLFLVELIRGDEIIPAVTPDVVLERGDILTFAGDTQTIIELINSSVGLSLPEIGMLVKKRHSDIVEIVVSHNSTLINKSVKQSNFRAKYDAAIISVFRNGEKISGKIGQVVIKAGDVLLLYAGTDFYTMAKDTHDFYFISKIKEFRKIENYKTLVLLGGLLAAIILSALKLVSLFIGLLVLIVASLLMGVAHPKEIAKNIDYNLGFIIALSLALGTAMEKTGAASLVAISFIKWFIPFGKIGVLFGIYLITTFLAAYITNKAAVAIIFPISLNMALNLNLNPMPFVLIVAYAAAANFMTPIGYQTNLMVYGPGKYRFTDFFKIGFPLTILYMVVTVCILSWRYFS